MSFEAKERAVDKLLNDAIYFIPRNQRRYVWNSQHWSDMYDDVLLVADKVASSHFIGSIVLKDEGKDERSWRKCSFGRSSFEIIILCKDVDSRHHGSN